MNQASQKADATKWFRSDFYNLQNQLHRRYHNKPILEHPFCIVVAADAGHRHTFSHKGHIHMSMISEERPSDSPYIEKVMHAWTMGDGSSVRPAESH